MIEDLTRALTCAYDLTQLTTREGDVLSVNKDDWCARVRQDWPATTEDQCGELYVFLAEEVAETGSLRCSVWQLAHAIEHVLVKRDLGTRH